MQQCPACHSKDLVTDHITGDIVCTCCGTVCDNNPFISSHSWRINHRGPTPHTTYNGAPTTYLLHDKGLGSQVPHPYTIKSSEQSPQSRWGLYNASRRGVVRGHESLVIAFRRIVQVSSQLRLSQVVQQTAAYVYRQALQRGVTVARNHELCVAAAIFIAARICQHILFVEDVAQVMELPGRYHRVLRMAKLMAREIGVQIPRISVGQYIHYICDTLDLPCRERAFELLDVLEKHRSQGISPRGLAAAVVYQACHETMAPRAVTLPRLANVVRVQSGTITAHVRQLRQVLRTGTQDHFPGVEGVYIVSQEMASEET